MLYVVDGVPIQSDTWNISPDDIESITVLKGLMPPPYMAQGTIWCYQITTKEVQKINVDFQLILILPQW